jgi:hypothetical protein
MKTFKEFLIEVGANPGTMGCDDGAVIKGANMSKVLNKKEKKEVKREKGMRDKHFGQ